MLAARCHMYGPLRCRSGRRWTVACPLAHSTRGALCCMRRSGCPGPPSRHRRPSCAGCTYAPWQRQRACRPGACGRCSCGPWPRHKPVEVDRRPLAVGSISPAGEGNTPGRRRGMPDWTIEGSRRPPTPFAGLRWSGPGSSARSWRSPRPSLAPICHRGPPGRSQRSPARCHSRPAPPWPRLGPGSSQGRFGDECPEAGREGGLVRPGRLLCDARTEAFGLGRVGPCEWRGSGRGGANHQQSRSSPGTGVEPCASPCTGPCRAAAW